MAKEGLIRSTTEFMIKRDEDTLKKLIENFKTFEEDSKQLEELEKLIDDEQLEYETIRNHVSRLENSDIPRIWQKSLSCKICSAKIKRCSR